MESTQNRWVILRSFLNTEERQKVVHEALECHYRNALPCQHSAVRCSCQWDGLDTSDASRKFSLGIPTGGDLSNSLPLAVKLARQAFQQASSKLTDFPTLKVLASTSTSLTGLVLLYGPKSSMKAHYDSPTQPGQREEWLVMFTVGSEALFRCNQEVLSVRSGDALVMDSMATLHGVERIVPDEKDAGLPVKGSRLGVLLWQGGGQQHSQVMEMQVVDGMTRLFEEEDE